MAGLAKVTGTVNVLTDTGASFTISITGHGPKDGTLHDLGPYVAKLLTQEVAKIVSPPPKQDGENARLVLALEDSRKVNDGLQAQVDQLGAALNRATSEVERLTAELDQPLPEKKTPAKKVKG